MTAQTTTTGPDVVVPGSQQVAPVAFGLLTVLALVAVVITAVLRRRRRRRGEPTRRPIVLSVAAAVALVAAGLTWVNRPPPFFVPEFAALPAHLLPEDTFYYRTVADLPVRAESERWIATQGSLPLGAGFSGEVVDGVVWGIPFNLVDDDTPRKDVDIVAWPDTSFLGPFPITDPAYIQSMPTYHFDQHYVGIDVESRQMWELLMLRSWFGRWEADSGARIDMDSSGYGEGTTIAAGLPLLPGTITYDEVAGGRVGHVVLAVTEVSRTGAHTWPARSTDGRSDDPDVAPQGAWLRLRAGTDLSRLGPQAQVVARGLQEYGLILSDTGPGFAVTGTPDARWDDTDLRTLSQLTSDDFEVVDPSGIKVADDSLAVRPPA